MCINWIIIFRHIGDSQRNPSLGINPFRLPGDNPLQECSRVALQHMLQLQMYFISVAMDRVSSHTWGEKKKLLASSRNTDNL